MGILNDYRLGDWFYTENELAKMDAELLDDSEGRYDKLPIKESIVVFNIVSKNGLTGKVLITKTEDVIFTMKALNRVWANTGLVFTIVKVGEPMYGAARLLDAIKVVLLPYKYETKFPDCKGANNVYVFNDWMLNLIRV